MEQAKLSWKTKIGYGLCSAAEVVPYNIFYIYFMFFLTDIVGISPMLAGVISFAAIVWDTVIDPPLGGMSDNYVTEKGRRLPWMKASFVPLGVMVFLIYAPFTFESTVLQGIYYIAMTILLWTFNSTFMMPWFSLASEITTSQNERNMLRFISGIGDYILLLLVSSGPMWIWEWASLRGFDDRQVWGFIGAVFAVLIFVMCGAGIRLMKNCEKDSIKAAFEARKTKVKENYYKIWASCLRVKSFRKIVIWIVIYTFGVTMLNTVVVYMMTHNAKMDAEQQGTFWIVFSVIMIVTLPLITFFANKYGKKPVVIATLLPSIAVSAIFFILGVDSAFAIYIFTGLWAVSASAFFTFYIVFAYDCTEIVEFKTGDRKDGSMSGLASFSEQVGAALGVYCTGVVLEIAGYDGTAEVQTGQALRGILVVGLLIPAIASAAAALFLMSYKVSKKKHGLLCAALFKKKAGEEYSTEGFEDIL